MCHMRISILGSCVSRDIFNAASPDEFSIEMYAARSSLGSMFSDVPMRDTYSPLIKSSFQRRMVKADLRKEIPTQLRATEPEVVLVDLIDERFNLLESRPGARFTLSVEMRNVLGARIDQFRTIFSGSDEFMQHWTEGWCRLVELVAERDMLNRVVVNKAYWQRETEGGEKFDAEMCDRANRMLETMYQRQAQDLQPNQFLDYGDALSCPDDHQWGPSPFHFGDQAYAFARSWITSFGSSLNGHGGIGG